MGGVALFIIAAAGIYHPEWEADPYQVMLIFWAVTLFTMSVCLFGNRFLPLIDVSSGIAAHHHNLTSSDHLRVLDRSKVSIRHANCLI